ATRWQWHYLHRAFRPDPAATVFPPSRSGFRRTPAPNSKMTPLVARRVATSSDLCKPPPDGRFGGTEVGYHSPKQQEEPNARSSQQGFPGPLLPVGRQRQEVPLHGRRQVQPGEGKREGREAGPRRSGLGVQGLIGSRRRPRSRI